MKKILCAFLSLIMLLTVLVGCNIVPDNDSKDTSENTESESNTEPQGTDFENELQESPATDFEYEINNAGYLTITKYIGSSKNVVIPSKIDDQPVVVIGQEAFAYCDIETVYMPDTVEAIIQYAFIGCEKLTDVRFSPNLVGMIGLSAFWGCKSLKSADLSSSRLEKIYWSAFKDCESLEKVTFGDNIKVIEKEAFMNCKSLKMIELPKNLEEIGPYAFYNCSKIECLTVPKSLYKWGMYAFCGTTSLKKIDFEDGLKNIGGSGLFGSCSVEEITIPASVEIIDNVIFYNTPLKKVIFEGNAPNVYEKAFGEESQPLCIYYDPTTDGWDTTALKNHYSVVPLETID